MSSKKVTKKDFEKWESHRERIQKLTKKYRLQIAFDIKDEYNKSILDKNTLNTVSRSIRAEIPTERQVESFRFAIMRVVSLYEEEPLFRNLFCVKIDYGCNAEGKPLAEVQYLEIPSEYQNYRSLIHSKGNKRLIPFVSKELWINRDIFSKIRLLRRKIQYYLNSLYELIRL